MTLIYIEYFSCIRFSLTTSSLKGRTYRILEVSAKAGAIPYKLEDRLHRPGRCRWKPWRESPRCGLVADWCWLSEITDFPSRTPPSFSMVNLKGKPSSFGHISILTKHQEQVGHVSSVLSPWAFRHDQLRQYIHSNDGGIIAASLTAGARRPCNRSSFFS